MVSNFILPVCSQKSCNLDIAGGKDNSKENQADEIFTKLLEIVWLKVRLSIEDPGQLKVSLQLTRQALMVLPSKFKGQFPMQWQQSQHFTFILAALDEINIAEKDFYEENMRQDPEYSPEKVCFR